MVSLEKTGTWAMVLAGMAGALIVIMNATRDGNRIYRVRSANFSWHQEVECVSYEDALAAAKSRGFEARIELGSDLVAVWSPLYGTHVYNRRLAS